MGEQKQIDGKSAEGARRDWWSDPFERPAGTRRHVGSDATPMTRPSEAALLPVIGYASCVGNGSVAAVDLKQQAAVIAQECKSRAFSLIEVVGERSPATSKGLSRPGLAYALERITSGEARGLVVVELSRITHSVDELGTIIDGLIRLGVRLVASADAFDTESEGGQLAAGLLVEVSRWERNRISERTRTALQAARTNGRSAGRPAVADDTDLSQRIAHMRAQGMTLQAIADRLNEERVPTVRGGAKWRHSSVQAAAGYRRRQRPPGGAFQIRPAAAGKQSTG